MPVAMQRILSSQAACAAWVGIKGALATGTKASSLTQGDLVIPKACE